MRDDNFARPVRTTAAGFAFQSPRTGRTMTDWAAIRAAYEGSDTPVRALARAHGLKSDNAVRKRAKAEKWERGAQSGAHAAHQANVVHAKAIEPMVGELIVPDGRDKAGRFVPGKSGNPGGKNGRMPEIVALARDQTEKVVRGLMEIANNGKHPAAARVRAYEVVAEFGWGKAPSTLFVEDNRESQQSSDNGAGIVAELEVLFKGIIRAKAHDDARATAQDAS